MHLFNRRKKHAKPEDAPEETPDIVSEQTDPVYTTRYSPESVKDPKTVRADPQSFIEINMIKKTRVVDTFAIPVTLKKFSYNRTKKSGMCYDVDEKYVYLLPTKHGYLMPTSFYKEGSAKPSRFLNTNQGITGKALTLLYSPQLYSQLFYSDEEKYNLLIVIFSVALLIAYAVGCYFVFFHEGGVLPPG